MYYWEGLRSPQIGHGHNFLDFSVVEGVADDAPVPPTMSDEPFDEQIGNVDDFQVEKTVEAATKVTVDMLMSAIANCLYQCSAKVQVFDIPQMTKTQHISNAGLSSSGEAYHIEFFRASLDNPEHVLTLQVSKNTIDPSEVLHALVNLDRTNQASEGQSSQHQTHKVMMDMLLTAIANCLNQCSARVQVFDTIPQMSQTQYNFNGRPSGGDAYHIEFLSNSEHVMTIQVLKSVGASTLP